MPTEIENGKVYMIAKDKYGNEKEIAIFDIKEISSDTLEVNCEITPPDRLFIGVNDSGNFKVKNHSAIKKMKRINSKDRWKQKVITNIVKKALKGKSIDDREIVKKEIWEEMKRQNLIGKIQAFTMDTSLGELKYANNN